LIVEFVISNFPMKEQLGFEGDDAKEQKRVSGVTVSVVKGSIAN